MRPRAGTSCTTRRRWSSRSSTPESTRSTRTSRRTCGRTPARCGNGIDDDGNGYVDDVYGIDCVDGDGDPIDDNGHGTHVAGTIAAVGNNGRGVTGVAWRAQIMALKVLDADGAGWYSDAIECIDYALVMKTRGVNVRVMNVSWGAPDFDQTLQDAFQTAGDLGILTVAAAGNDGAEPRAAPVLPGELPARGAASRWRRPPTRARSRTSRTTARTSRSPHPACSS